VAILVQRSDVGEFRRRYRWLVLVVLVAFFACAVRLFVLQVLQGDLHDAEARKNIIGETRLATTRGVIRDAFGRVLAANRPSYNVHVVPQLVDMKTTWPRLVELMELTDADASALREKVSAIIERGGARAEQQTLLQMDVSRDVVAAIETYRSELPGVRVVPAPVRSYPYGTLGAHMIGYMREVDAETLAEHPEVDYRAGDRFGAVGVERRWESYLRGQRGFRRFIRKKTKRERIEDLEERYLGEDRQQDPAPGRDISLTLDIDLVRSAEKAMRGHLAGAVADAKAFA